MTAGSMIMDFLLIHNSLLFNFEGRLLLLDGQVKGGVQLAPPPDGVDLVESAVDF